MNKLGLDTSYFFMLMTGVLVSCLLSELVIADEDADHTFYEPAIRVSPPPPGPWVSQKRTVMKVPQYIVGSYRPMNEFTTDDMRQMPADNVWDPHSSYTSGPSSFDIYGPSNYSYNESEYINPEARPMQNSESTIPFAAQPVPGAYETRQFQRQIDYKATRNNQSNYRQPVVSTWPQER